MPSVCAHLLYQTHLGLTLCTRWARPDNLLPKTPISLTKWTRGPRQYSLNLVFRCLTNDCFRCFYFKVIASEMRVKQFVDHASLGPLGAHKHRQTLTFVKIYKKPLFFSTQYMFIQTADTVVTDTLELINWKATYCSYRLWKKKPLAMCWEKWGRA